MQSEQLPRLTLTENGATGHICAKYRTVQPQFPIHWHTFFEVEIIVEGSGIHVLNGEEYVLSAGDAYILTPTDYHKILHTEPIKQWNISFDEEMLSDRRICELSSAGLRRYRSLGSTSLSQLCSIAEILSQECTLPDGGCSRELCESLLCILLRDGAGNAVQERSHVTGIRKSLLYLDVHFRENPSLAQAAAQAGFHPHYFSEMFRRVTGKNYSAYLNGLRTGYAKALLSKGFSVTEACYQSGFGSMSNFLVVFKKQIGCSPEEYKRRDGGRQ